MIANIKSNMKIKYLKYQLKSNYSNMRSIGNSYDCGHTLAKEISVDYSEVCRTVNKILDELALIDPATPTTRF